MTEIGVISGRDIYVYINGKQILQAESMEIHTLSDIHKIRACFCNDDVAHIKTKNEYKVVFKNLKLKQPFENCNFYDLDNFTVTVMYGSTKITVDGCMWSDFLAVTDKSQFRESISITGLRMNVEETV